MDQDFSTLDRIVETMDCIPVGGACSPDNITGEPTAQNSVNSCEDDRHAAE